MGRIVFWRLVQLVVVSIILATVLFFALRATGDPISFILGSDATNEQIEEVRRTLGLDRPLHVQYFSFLWGLLPRYSEGSWKFLDFGNSITSQVPAMPIVLDHLPATLALGGVAMAMAALISIPLGVVATLQRGRFLETAVMVLALFGQAVPNFLLALVLILVFGVTFQVFPVFDFTGPKSLVLPAISLSAFTLARQTRLLRSQLLEVAAQDYVRTARAKGLRERRVVLRHQLPNALIPWVTMLGMDVGYLLGGSIILETIFAWPGVGSLLITSINFRDYPMVQAIVFIVGVIVILGNLLTDISYRWLDPRVRYVG